MLITHTRMHQHTLTAIRVCVCVCAFLLITITMMILLQLFLCAKVLNPIGFFFSRKGNASFMNLRIEFLVYQDNF